MNNPYLADQVERQRIEIAKLKQRIAELEEMLGLIINPESLNKSIIEEAKTLLNRSSD